MRWREMMRPVEGRDHGEVFLEGVDATDQGVGQVSEGERVAKSVSMIRASGRCQRRMEEDA